MHRLTSRAHDVFNHQRSASNTGTTNVDTDQTADTQHQPEQREERDDDLEHRLSHVTGADREGTVGDSTELAAPEVVSRSRNRRYSSERETNAARKQSQGTPSSDGEHFLTELEAPAPVERDSDRHLQHLQDTNAVQPPSGNTWEADEDAQAVPTGDVDKRSSTMTAFYIHSYLVSFSILGTLARSGLEAITTYPNATTASTSLWANTGGSFFLGFSTEDHRLFREEWGNNKDSPSSNDSDLPQREKASDSAADHKEVKKTLPLYIGLAVGFCGSFTSFSSFIRDVFFALANHPSAIPVGREYGVQSPEPRNGGYSFEATIAVIILHVAISIGALITGAHFAMALDPLTPTLPFKLVRQFIDPLSAVVSWGVWLGALFLTVWPPDNRWRAQVLFSILFAPLGCSIRFYASKHLNGRIQSFPSGTFTINISGTAILGACFDLEHSQLTGGGVNGNMIACGVLEGIMEGFCGCLTTVSTWVAESTTLRRRHSYIYGVSTVLTATGLLVAVMGSVSWDQGFVEPACG